MNHPESECSTDRSFEFEITTTGDPGWTITWGMSHISDPVAQADDIVSKDNTAAGARIEAQDTAGQENRRRLPRREGKRVLLVKIGERVHEGAQGEALGGYPRVCRGHAHRRAARR